MAISDKIAPTAGSRTCTAHSAGKKEFIVTEQEKQSSEVKDQEAEKSAAEEALEATADPASEAEPTVPLHDHTALRKRAQTAELEAANLRGQLEATNRATQTQALPVKGPLQVEIERQTAEGIDEADMTVSPKIFLAQEAHTRAIAEQTAANQAQETVTVKQRASAGLSRVKHDDFQTVITEGLALMTKGQILDIESEVDNFGENLYAKAQEVIERNANPESKTKTAPEEKQSESEAEEKVPSQDEILKDLNVDPATEAASKL